MSEVKERPILGKVFIRGRIKVLTGLRIGGDTGEISIGGIDLVVVRDPLTNQPYIPGSSLKGKMRALFERLENAPLYDTTPNADEGEKIFRHECGNPNCKICRLYGSANDWRPDNKDKNNGRLPARIIVRDCFLTEESARELLDMETPLPYTEWKTENALDRISSAANLRHIERVPAGAEFRFEIVYTAEKEEHIEEDIKNIFRSLKLVEDDYLGWGGSRGSGKVEFAVEEVLVRSRDYYLKGEGERAVSVPEKLEGIIKEKELEKIASEIKRNLG